MRGAGTRPVTKQQLGLLFVLAGAAGILLPFLADLTGRAEYGGIGPTQRLLLIAAAGILLLGLTLLPLGDRPA